MIQDKNGADAASVISLPQGGGALSGIGETFAPDLHTGTGNYTVPIAIPPGRDGFQPELKLVYSTGNGNDAFGLGWQLDIPGVSRKTDKGVPSYDDTDLFILSGAEELVPVDQSETRTRYRPRTEGLFARIVHHHDGNSNYWRVQSKDGLQSLYGTPDAAGDDPAAVANPHNRQKVFAWKLTETRDPFGNRIRYEYLRDAGEEGGRAWDRLYLRQIRYANYIDGDGDEQFLISLNFEYEDLPDRYDQETPRRQRVYPFSRYRAGFEIRTRKRCKRIRMEVHPEADGVTQTQPVRTYELTYLDERIADRESLAALLPHNGVALLSRVEAIGSDGMERLPPLEFAYTSFDPEGRQFQAVCGSDLLARSLSDPNLEMVDLFGNGLPDLLETGATVRYWRNLGEGRFDVPREMREAPSGLALSDPGVQLIDANGNGRPDLLVAAAQKPGVISGYYPTRPGGGWDRRSFQRYSTAPSFNFADPQVQLVDLDGDGVTDALHSGSQLTCFFNDPQDGWGETRRVERGALPVFPNVNFSDVRVRFADMSGDGLEDIVLIHDGHIAYWPSLGHGNWGGRISMQDSPRFTRDYDPSRILVADVDGDGLADIVYVDSDTVTLWINQSGSGWSDPVTVRGTPLATGHDAVRPLDFLGTGIRGILWSRHAGAPGRSHMHFLDFTGGVKPYLLSEVDNHTGALTRVAYTPSTRFYLADEALTATRWTSTLPFPVQVVARVEVIDVLSKGRLTTEYSYHHGYWDGTDREFRGFGRVDQRDTESFERYHDPGLHAERPFEPVDQVLFSPPTETRTWFHQGPVGDEFGEWQERDYTHEVWAGDPQLLHHTEQVSTFLQSYHSGPHGRASPADRRIRREALRTLRGSVLRTELYALDGSPLQGRPYIVKEVAYGLREEAKLDAADGQRRRIFFPHRRAARTTQWERGDDPMTQFTFSDDYDDFGQPREQTTVALPRRIAKRQEITGAVVGVLDGDEVNETRVLATHTRTLYAEPDPDVVIHDRVAQVRAYEMKQPPEVDETDPDDLAQVLRDQAGTADSVHERFRSTLSESLQPSDLRLVDHTLNHYDGEAFVGRAAGEVGPYGALTRSEALVFTERELEEAYADRRPSYLGGEAAPPEGAPDSFGQHLGYRLEQESGDYHAGYYIDTQRQRFDVQEDEATEKWGLVTAIQDSLGHQTTIEPDRYRLLPARIIDPVGLETVAAYDYRVMQPRSVTDPNGNTTHFRYTPLGLLHKRFLEGRDGEGGSEEKPEVELIYDFLAYEKTRDDPDPQPIFAHRRRRIRHASETTSDETIASREYSDGFGRLIQTRAQAEDLIFGETGDDVGLPRDPGAETGAAVGRRAGDRVVVSGWKVYDNKGKVVEQYEPFFAGGWAYQREDEAKKGRHATQFYDPRGRRIRTVNPDGSEERLILGIPERLDDPDGYAPTPWERTAYDPNDLATVSRISDEAAASVPETHPFTPTGTIRDAFGRVTCRVERNGRTAESWHIIRRRHDLRGNLLAVTDPLGRPAFEYAYDLLDRQLRVRSIDAGLRTSVPDATGSPIEQRDSRGAVVLRRYDDLNRLTHLWARDGGRGPVTLRERLIYGDDGNRRTGLTGAEAREQNLLGKLFRHYDEAGVVEFRRYDFKGNLEEKVRQVISDSVLAKGWTADWDRSEAERDLDAVAYRTNSRFDALNRPLEMVLPADVNGERAALVPRYNRAGALERVELEGDPYVAHIAYNAKGQRVLIVYGNGLMTRYAYDPDTFRLKRLRTERAQTASTDTFAGEGEPLQDLTYRHDLIGNVTTIEEHTPNSGIANSAQGRDRLVRAFAYDPLYRLTEATGRAGKDTGAPPRLGESTGVGRYVAPYRRGAPAPTQDNAPDLTAPYTERYAYDPAGNLLTLRRAIGDSATRRDFTLADDSNRLRSVAHGSTVHRYRHDANGNVTLENSERHATWDHADRMIAFATRPEGSDHASVAARYLYGADGMRVKKVVRKNGSERVESTVYIGSVFEHDAWTENGSRRENNHVHVMDDRQRIARVRRGPAHPKDAGPPVQVHLGDHLGSSHVVVDAGGAWVNREEYFPYGETGFGSFARKRYRFTGKERDEESGLSYHGARYYAPWLGRWVSCDPAGTVDGVNIYTYVQGNPVSKVDPKGLQSSDAEEQVDWREGTPVRMEGSYVGPGFQIEGVVHAHEPGLVIEMQGESPIETIDRTGSNKGGGEYDLGVMGRLTSLTLGAFQAATEAPARLKRLRAPALAALLYAGRPDRARLTGPVSRTGGLNDTEKRRLIEEMDPRSRIGPGGVQRPLQKGYRVPGWASRAGKFAGPAGTLYDLGLLTTELASAPPEEQPRVLAEGTGGMAGGAGGAKVGAAVGFSLGNIPGGVVGGIAGGWIGSLIGKRAGGTGPVLRVFEFLSRPIGQPAEPRDPRPRGPGRWDYAGGMPVFSSGSR